MAPAPRPIPPKPGQESVWDYPRPAICAPTPLRLKVEFAGRVIADTARGQRTLETSHPPTYYIPPEDIAAGVLQPNAERSLCEWKGQARYFDVVVDGKIAAKAAWSYPDPTPGFVALRDHVAFYPGAMDACFVGGEQVEPQPGGFYGGWVTSHVAGPFKGGPGSWGW
ncbi:MAG: DUF427 domain-containing protein [Pseudomonadota bacterium]